MGVIKSHQGSGKNSPSVFALLVDDIRGMTESEQKLLWMQINKEKLSGLAKEIDSAVSGYNYSSDEIDAMIKEARKNGNEKG